MVAYMNPFAAIAAVPIRSVAPVNKSAEDGKFEASKPKVNSRIPSAQNSRQSASESLRRKHSKNKRSASRKTEKKVELGENIRGNNRNEVQKEANYDFSHVPPPVCSCTGFARRCYKYGPGGWQSTCCTTSTSEYPLPMSPWRPGRRITGRKMKSGAYVKLLIKLSTEGHDLSHPVDLKNHWCKHGSNKFVSIK